MTLISQQIGESSLRRLYSYWSDKRGSRSAPSRHDIDPVDFRYLWGNIMMLDVLRDPLRFRVRLHGTEMAKRAGYDMTGKMLDALPDSEYRAYVIARCEALVETVAPDVVHHDRILDGRVWRYEALWLPFPTMTRRSRCCFARSFIKIANDTRPNVARAK